MKRTTALDSQDVFGYHSKENNCKHQTYYRAAKKDTTKIFSKNNNKKKTRKIVHCQSCIADTLIYKMNHRVESIMKNKKKSNKEWESVKCIHFLEQTPWL